MSAARDVLHDLAAIGARIERAGDQILLRAGATAVPAGLVGRIREAKAELLATLTPRNAADATQAKNERASGEAEPVAGLGLFKRVGAPAESERGFDEPCALRKGRVEERNGILLHFCAECGRWGGFGCGVKLRAGQLGRWYCAAHRPQRIA